MDKLAFVPRSIVKSDWYGEGETGGAERPKPARAACSLCSQTWRPGFWKFGKINVKMEKNVNSSVRCACQTLRVSVVIFRIFPPGLPRTLILHTMYVRAVDQVDSGRRRNFFETDCPHATEKPLEQKMPKHGGAKAEVQQQKSPAEFFAENQAIAGFDNLGKSLYTTIRELVENGLDACEAVHQLPSIAVCVKEYTQAEFNKQGQQQCEQP